MGSGKEAGNTFAISDFFSVACKCCAAVFGEDVQLLCSGTEVLDELAEQFGLDTPNVLCAFLVEDCMNDLDGFVDEFVGFDDAFELELDVDV
jgi:hypothetical protein